MTTDKEQKKPKENAKEKKQFIPPIPKAPKPFQQFSSPNKFKGGPPKSFNAFHRRLGK